MKSVANPPCVDKNIASRRLSAKHVGQYVRQIRRDRKLSLRELAKDIGVGAASLGRLERGICQAPTDLLSRIAGRLEVSESRLLSLAAFDSDDRLPTGGGDMAREEDEEYRLHLGPAADVLKLGPNSLNARLRDPLSDFLPSGLIPSAELNEVYELRLAKLESELLTRRELIERGAYFVVVDGEPTNHFKICTGGAIELPQDAGSRLQSFLGTHRFKSSYATHGLFPYRGKFHPQMIKAIINVMGIKVGGVVLDPMGGSGTTAVEASLMGIDSVTLDLSPFCAFMARAKLAGLTENLDGLDAVLDRPAEMERVFKELSTDAGKRKICDRTYISKKYSRGCLDILGLAHMDAQGFAVRSSRKTSLGFFTEVLTKYVRTMHGFHVAWSKTGLSLGRSQVLQADARQLPLAEHSVDGVVFSPPYSFAIDYLDNDRPHLEYLGADLKELQRNLIGLRGRNARDRATQYFEDMNLVLKEIARVLRQSSYCTIIVGSNSNQLSRALGLDPESNEARYGIETRLVEMGQRHGLKAELAIRRLIVGMANTMREEHILFLRKGS